MTDDAERIIKALRICDGYNRGANIVLDAADQIERDQAEIERLTADLENAQDRLSYARGGFDELLDESVKFSKEVASYQQMKKALQDKGFTSLEAVFGELEQVTRERDALLMDVKESQCLICQYCKHYYKVDPNGGKHSRHSCTEFGDGLCKTALGCGRWEWRGLCAENGGDHDAL